MYALNITHNLKRFKHTLYSSLSFEYKMIYFNYTIWKEGNSNMAKYERRFKGDFDHFVKYVETDIVNGSRSANLEESSDFISDNFRIAVRVFERYSAFSSSRVSLNVTIASDDNLIFISAIPAGGSRALFFKIDTVGEEEFLSKLSQSVDNYIFSTVKD